MGRITLVRHTEVAAHWKGRCYGQSDVGLSRAGRAAARTLAAELAALRPDRIVVSPLRRARFLAGLVAREGLGVAFHVEPRLMECHFGAWEGRPWDDIHAETGDAMMGMIEAPATFRPGGDGETTFEVRDRAMAWLQDTRGRDESVIAICHGGPIAAILGTIGGLDVERWPSSVPRPGAVLTLPPS